MALPSLQVLEIARDNEAGQQAISTSGKDQSHQVAA
jgi:hypothetical protein